MRRLAQREQCRADQRVYGYLENRIKLFVSLPIASLDRLSLQNRLDQIGRTADETAA